MSASIVAPVLLSVVSDGNGHVTFTWQPWAGDGLYGTWGSCQGFDDRGEHVIGSFLYPDQLAAGSAVVDCGEKHKKAVIHCQVFAAGHTTPTQYPADPTDQLLFAPSNTVDLSLGR